MSTAQIIGLVLLLVGLVLLFFGWQSTQSFTEGAREVITGRYSDETILYLVGGGASALTGLLLLIFKK